MTVIIKDCIRFLQPSTSFFSPSYPTPPFFFSPESWIWPGEGEGSEYCFFNFVHCFNLQVKVRWIHYFGTASGNLYLVELFLKHREPCFAKIKAKILPPLIYPHKKCELQWWWIPVVCVGLHWLCESQQAIWCSRQDFKRKRSIYLVAILGKNELFCVT